ncbi:NAD(P)-dependent oxidoreductase [Natronoglomus mannanivorans]|uniref:NAD(P)-binding domain-containing protein n=1 Tax=Natronoglomus mannanivorans TaxID=2979990 RepID=A0AAP2YZ15_9EURY|nr:NAD(P)-binding domain-containing protein [Halobacteria archaeon AArc-xg1-1]
MSSAIVVHPLFESVWPHAADHLRRRWEKEGPLEYHRLDEDHDDPLGAVFDDPTGITRLVSLGVPVTDDCLDAFADLEQATVLTRNVYEPDEEIVAALEDRGVTHRWHDSEGFWSASVAELALGLTIGALRQIPQKHASITRSHDDWDRELWESEVPGAGGYQYVADPPSHTHGTIAGKRVRIVGVGNIGSRYADVTDSLGADVAAYDPYADEPCFHRTGADRIHSLEELVADAEIFAPMVPLTDGTRGLVDADLVRALPDGTLVVLVTRAGIVDGDALRERVLADELALAADVFDGLAGEPIPLDDPLLGRENVVHTPHVAGRTRHANEQWAVQLADRFEPA